MCKNFLKTFVCLLFMFILILVHFTSDFIMGSATKIRTEEILIKTDFIHVFQSSPSTPGAYEGLICFALLADKLWEPGNTEQELMQHLADNLRFFIEGKQINSKPVSQVVFSGPLKSIYDSEGRYIGASGGYLNTCFKIELCDGNYSARVEVKTLSGKTGIYEWIFEVTN